MHKTREEKTKVKKLIWVTVLVMIFWIAVFLGLLVGFSQAMGYSAPLAEKNDLGLKTYWSKKLNLGFDYDKRFKIEEKKGMIIIKHNINFNHLDPCDRSGLHPKSKEVYDFYVTIKVLDNTNLDKILTEKFISLKNGERISLKNADMVDFNGLKGFRLYNGNHGCGPYSYYFYAKLFNRVFQVDRYPASEFGEIFEEERQMYSRLRMIILPEEEEHLFRNIIISFKTKVEVGFRK